jgi:branched-chain amino acid transport system ATP-binding protein
MTDVALHVEGLVAGYGAAEVLHGVSLAVRSGEALAVVGPNGAGKSTLLKTISGLVRARAGTIEAGGRAIRSLPTHAIVAAGVVHVPEGRQVFPEMSVKANLQLGGFSSPHRSAERLEEVLDLFKPLRGRLGQSADSLSGGEQQMLAIGRGLMARPTVLMLDEPTLGLAPIIVEELLEMLLKARSELSTSILVTEQNAYLTKELCDRYCVLINGRVTRQGDEMPDDPAVLMSEYLGETVTP